MKKGSFRLFTFAKFALPIAFLIPVLMLSRCNRGVESAVTFNPADAPYSHLSEYHFFRGALALESPNDRVLKYELISPLFSDYAWKNRYIYLPPGARITQEDDTHFKFPVGTALIKTFFYPGDFNKPEGNRRILETRLLVNRESGWEALPYVWNEAQTEATLEIAGSRTPVSWIDAQGKNQSIEYVVPNKNQCKNCHSRNEVMTPIGPRARNLNRLIPTTGEGSMKNQLDWWVEKGILAERPGVGQTIADYEDPKASISDRARAYLDMNCAHCHNPEGLGGTSGLDLSLSQINPTQMGICKEPVAAGKGAGDFLYDIHPGRPESSIMVYRMESTDPGVMMPELGRKMTHAEGLALVKEWIAGMSGACRE